MKILFMDTQLKNLIWKSCDFGGFAHENPMKIIFTAISKAMH